VKVDFGTVMTHVVSHN